MQATMTLPGFIERIERAWCKKTSADPDKWSEFLPEHGQCAVTALVVQDILGGQLLRAEIDGVSHYWNRLPGRGHLDLCAGQFPQDAECTSEVVERERDYVLSFPDTLARYELLRDRLERYA